MISLVNDYKDQGFRIIGLSVEDTEKQPVEKFLEDYENEIPFQLAYMEREVWDRYQEFMPPAERGFIPVNAFVDRQGKLVSSTGSLSDKAEIEALILPLLKAD